MDTRYWKTELLCGLRRHIRIGDIIEFRENGKLHNLNLPAVIGYYPDGKINYMVYYYEGRKHRSSKEGPTSIGFTEEGTIYIEYYFNMGKLHRTDGPAKIIYYDNGNIQTEEYWVNGEKIEYQL